MNTDSRLSSRGRAEAFALSCQRFSEAAAAAGIRVLPFRDATVPLFANAPAPVQGMAVEYVDRHLAIFGSLTAECGPQALRDSPKLVWRALHALGCVPPGDLFDKIEDDDTIEIYSSDCIQLFRNLSFFKFISLTLEELCTCPIPTIVDMPPEQVKFLMSCLEKYSREELSDAFQPEIPITFWREKVGEKLAGKAEAKWIAPVRRKDGELLVLTVTRHENVAG